MASKKFLRHLERSKLYYLFVITIVLMITFQFIYPSIQNLRTGPAQDTPYVSDKGRVSIYEPFGVCHGYGESSGDYKGLIDQGVQISRNDIPWEAVERTNDSFDFKSYDYHIGNLSALGVESLAILDYGNRYITGEENYRYVPKENIPDWLDYVEEVVLRYEKNVSYFEIWNEPNIDKFWSGTDEQFFYLLNETAHFIDSIAPNVKLLPPGISGHDPNYLDRMITYVGDECFNDLFYALNFHPYSGSNAELIPSKIEEVKEIAIKHSYNGELWITEVGMSTQVSSLDAINAEYQERWNLQGEQLIKTYVQALAAGVDKLVWYCYRDWKNINWTYGEAAFGLQHYSSQYGKWIYKPAGYAYQYLSDRLTNSIYYDQGALISAPQWVEQNFLHVYPFFTPKNTMVLLIWSQTTSDKAKISLAPQARDALVGGIEYTVSEYNYITNSSFQHTLKTSKSLSVSLDNAPVVLEVNFTEASTASSLNADIPLQLQVLFQYSNRTGTFIRLVPWIFLLGVALVANKIDIRKVK